MAEAERSFCMFEESTCWGMSDVLEQYIVFLITCRLIF
jgi:hypothetical protein